MATNYRDKIKESNQHQKKKNKKKTPIIRLTHDFIRFDQANYRDNF
jgi:hypothetical protein